MHRPSTGRCLITSFVYGLPSAAGRSSRSVVVVVVVSSIRSSVSYVITSLDSLFPKLYVIIIMSYISSPTSSSWPILQCQYCCRWCPPLQHRPCLSSNICTPDGVTIVLEHSTLYLSQSLSLFVMLSPLRVRLSLSSPSAVSFILGIPSARFSFSISLTPLLLHWNTPPSPLSPHQPANTREPFSTIPNTRQGNIESGLVFRWADLSRMYTRYAVILSQPAPPWASRSRRGCLSVWGWNSSYHFPRSWINPSTMLCKYSEVDVDRYRWNWHSWWPRSRAKGPEKGFSFWRGELWVVSCDSPVLWGWAVLHASMNTAVLGRTDTWQNTFVADCVGANRSAKCILLLFSICKGKSTNEEVVFRSLVFRSC
jgi:hypothetical protein